MAKYTAIFDLEDRISRKLERMTRGLEKAQGIAEKLNQVHLGATDKASPVLDKLKKKIEKQPDPNIMINARDNTKRAFDQMNRKIKRTPKEHTMLITGKDNTQRALKSAERRFKQSRLNSYSARINLDDYALRRGLVNLRRRLNNDIPNTKTVHLTARDRVSSIVQRVNNRIITMVRRSNEIVLRARDEASRQVSRFNSFARRTLSRGYTATVSVVDRLTTQVNRMSAMARNALGRSYNMTAGLIDRASGPARRVFNFANNNLNRTFTMTVKLADLATRPLRKVGGLMSSTGAMLGFGAGAYGGVVAPLQAQAQRQNMTTAFETLLGSRQAAEDRLDELISFAGQTPFARDEIFEASRVLQIFTDGALASGEGMKLVGDIAAGTQKPFADVSLWVGRLYDGLQNGRPIGDSAAALQEMGAISGASRAKLEELAESGRDISEIWPEATKEFERFDDMMIKMSDNLANLTLGAKSFVNNAIIMPWGAGLANVVQPALEAFRTWRVENGHVIAEMTKQMEVAGENFAQAIMNPMGKTFGFIGDQLQILFPGELTSELQEKFKDDPALEKRFKELDAYRNMTLQARWDIVWDNTVDVFGTWWNDVGEPGLLRMVGKVGSTYGGILNGLITGLLDIDDKHTGNAFVDAGAAAGRTFISSFIEAFDPAEISGAIGKKLWEVNATGLKSVAGKTFGKEEWVTDGAIQSMVIADTIAIAVAAAIAAKITPLISAISKIVRGIGKVGRKIPTWLGGGKKGPKPVPLPSGQNRQPGTTSRPPVVGGVQTRSNRGKLPKNDPRYNRNPWFSNDSKGGFGKRVLGAAKRIPLVGPAIGALALAGATQEEKPGIIGSIGGGLAGASAGAAIGSVVPGIGTAIGGVVGGIAGSLGGGAAGDWLGRNWDTIKEKSSDTIAFIGDTMFSGEWWSKQWNKSIEGTKDLYNGSWLDKTITAISDTIFSGGWWSKQWNKAIEGTKSLYQDSWLDKTITAISDTIFSGEWWSSKWNDAVDGAKSLYEGSWLDKSLTAISNTLFNGEWWSEKWDEVKKLASNLADPSWWAYTAGKTVGYLSETLFSGEWWSTKWAEVVSYASLLYDGSWLDNTLTSIGDTLFSSDWWGEKWDSVVRWTAEKATEIGLMGLDVANAINETVFNSEWWSEKWDSVIQWTAEKATQIGALGWNMSEGIRETLFSSEWWNEKWDSVIQWTAEKAFVIGQKGSDIAQGISDTLFSSDWWSEQWDTVTKLTAEKAFVIGQKGLDMVDGINSTLFNSDWWNEKWDSVIQWTAEKALVIGKSGMDMAQGINETLFSADWWNEKWNSVVQWSATKAFEIGQIGLDIANGIDETLFSYDWWSGKWNQVKGWGESILSGIGGWVNDTLVEPFKAGKETGSNAGKAKVNQSKANTASNNQRRLANKNARFNASVTPYANGGIINRPHLGLVGEAGREAIIPLNASRRSRALDLYEQTGRELGVQPYANGALVGAATTTTPAASVAALVSLDKVNAAGIEKDAQVYGQKFSEAVATGANGNVISLNAWKQNNIATPMQGVVQEAVGFGSSTVASFSRGQFSSATQTDMFLNQQVKQPFTVIQGGATAHGSGTVRNFKSGQDATPTGTHLYLVEQVQTPFESTVAKGSGWGSGLTSQFAEGLRSNEAQVREAAKVLADAVEATFRKTLGIHSPSRVMTQLGHYASVGIINGLGSVDLEKFAADQMKGLIGTYAAGMPNFGTGFRMTSGFGPRKSPEGIGSTNHRGVDYAAPIGTPIPAQAGGMVTYSGWMGSYGNVVFVKGAGGMEYRYAHNSKNNVKVGDMVKPGQTIALVGSTGNSTGPHVHYEIRQNGKAINPAALQQYANGGLITHDHIARVGEGGRREWIIPGERGIRGRYLLGQAANDLGMQVVDDEHYEVPDNVAQQLGLAPRQSSGQQQAASSTSNNNQENSPTINLYITGDNIYHNDTDVDLLLSKMRNELATIFRNMRTNYSLGVNDG